MFGQARPSGPEWEIHKLNQTVAELAGVVQNVDKQIIENNLRAKQELRLDRPDIARMHFASNVELKKQLKQNLALSIRLRHRINNISIQANTRELVEYLSAMDGEDADPNNNSDSSHILQSLTTPASTESEAEIEQMVKEANAQIEIEDTDIGGLEAGSVDGAALRIGDHSA